MASSEIFKQIVFFAKVASEHAHRQYRNVPKIIVVTAGNNPEVISRFKQLKRSAGLDIEIVSSVKIAKQIVGKRSIWQTLNFV